MSTRRFLLAASGLGLVLALALTHPLVTAPATTVLDDGTHDAFQFLWNVWWVRASLVDGLGGPFFTRYLFYPQGVPLLFHTYSFTLGLLSVPLQLLFGLVTAHNLLVIGAPMLGVVCTALLARAVTGDARAALVAGAIVALNPIAVWFLPIIYLNCIWLVALLMWTWWELHVRRRVGIVVAALVLSLMLVFASQEYAIITLGLLLLDTLLRLVAGRRLALPPAWIGGTIAFWVVCGAGLAALAKVAMAEPASPPPPIQLLLASGYLAGFVTPPWLWPPVAPFWTVLYVGTAPLLLLVVALAVGGRRVVPWLVALVVLLAMSLGPMMHVHHPLPEMRMPPEGFRPSGPPGPYALAMALVPMLQFFRAPYRWVAIAQVALAVLAAIAVAGLHTRLGASARRLVAPIALAMVLLLGAADVRGLRAPIASAVVPSAYDVIRADAAPSAILELPSGPELDRFGFWSSYYMFWQTTHRKFLLEGTVSRLPPGYQWVLQRTFDDFATLPWIQYVVVHRDFAARSHESMRAQIARVEEVLARQGDPLVRDGDVEVWRLRTFRPETVR